MFNFDLLNEAVFDTKLTDKEFRLLYVIANNAAMNKVNTVQLNNGWLMDKLDCCERQIRRLTNGLNQKGYVIKTVTGTSKNKNSNTYTLERTLQEDKNVPLKTSENREKNEVKPQYDDKNVDKNVPLKNNKKIKENINNLSTKDINDSRRMITEEKEKINKKESGYGDSLQSETPEDNTINVFSNIPSGDVESAQSSTDEWDSAVFGTPPVEEDLHISIGISNNCAGHALTPQVEQESTLNEKMQQNAPQTAKNASFEKMTPQTPENEPQNIKNNAPERAQNEQTPHEMDNSTPEGIKTRQNAQECPQIEFDEKWYNDTYALMDYFKTREDLDELYNRLKQCKNKRMIMDFKYKVWHSYDLNDSDLQNRAMQIVTELTRMRA